MTMFNTDITFVETDGGVFLSILGLLVITTVIVWFRNKSIREINK